MDETLYKSNKQLKAEERIAIREQFLGEKRVAEITKRWEDAQVTAAGWQSVLDRRKTRSDKNVPDDRKRSLSRRDGNTGRLNEPARFWTNS